MAHIIVIDHFNIRNDLIIEIYTNFNHKFGIEYNFLRERLSTFISLKFQKKIEAFINVNY